jgi:hypothetical protein
MEVPLARDRTSMARPGTSDEADHVGVPEKSVDQIEFADAPGEGGDRPQTRGVQEARAERKRLYGGSRRLDTAPQRPFGAEAGHRWLETAAVEALEQRQELTLGPTEPKIAGHVEDSDPLGVHRGFRPMTVKPEVMK